MNPIADTRTVRNSLELFIISLGKSPIIAILGLGLLFSLMIGGQRVVAISWGRDALLYTAIALGTIFLWEVVRHIATRPHPFAIGPFFALAVILGLAVRTAYVIAIQPEWYTDFERYWIYGLKLASGELSEVHNGYARRANFLTRPLIEIFGPNPKVIPYTNVLVLTLVQILGYDILRRLRSHQAAQSFSLLWIAVPIPLMTATVPNHDLIGLLLICALLWLSVISLNRRNSTPGYGMVIGCGLIGGILITFLEIVRGLGTLYLYCLGLMIGAAAAILIVRGKQNDSLKKVLISSTLFLITVVFVSFCTELILRQAGTLTPPDVEKHDRLLYTTPHLMSISDGTYNFKYAFDQAFMSEFKDNTEALHSFRNAISATDLISSPVARIQSTIARMKRMYSLGSEQSFYLRGIGDFSRRSITAYNIFFGTTFSAILLLSILRLSLRHPSAVPAEAFLLLLTATVSAVLLFIGENQPRYISIIWLSGALVIPSQMFLDHRNPVLTQPRPTQLFLVSACILVGLFAILWAGISTLTHQSQSQVLNNWTYSIDGSKSQESSFFRELRGHTSHVLIGSNGKSLPRKFGPLSITLMLPPAADRISAESDICRLAGPSSLEFHYNVSLRKKKPSPQDLVTLYVNGERVWETPLIDTKTPRLVRTRIPFSERGCAHFQFKLERAGQANPGSHTFDPLVEIFFPRIRRM